MTGLAPHYMSIGGGRLVLEPSPTTPCDRGPPKSLATVVEAVVFPATAGCGTIRRTNPGSNLVPQEARPLHQNARKRAGQPVPQAIHHHVAPDPGRRDCQATHEFLGQPTFEYVSVCVRMCACECAGACGDRRVCTHPAPTKTPLENGRHQARRQFVARWPQTTCRPGKLRCVDPCVQGKPR